MTTTTAAGQSVARDGGLAAAGGVTITESDLRRLFPRARDDYVAALLEGAPVLAEHGITATAARWCAFVANVGEETGGLVVVREDMRYTAHNLLKVWPARYPNTVAGRAKAALHARRGARYVANYNYGFRLGNRGRATDDGWAYRGALLLQATGRAQAEWLQQQTGRPYADQPDLFDVVDVNAVTIAALTWTRKVGDLNEYADRGLFRACCNGINRGDPRSATNPIGWEARQAWHRKALAIWGDRAGREPATESVLEEGDRGWEIEKFQERLKALGYHSVGTVDGSYGDNTATAVMNFQRVNGLTVDGKIGPETRRALASAAALPKPIGEGRAAATVADLEQAGSQTVNLGLWGRVAAFLTGTAGVGSTAWEGLQMLNTTTTQVKTVVTPAITNAGWLAKMWPLGLVVVAIVLWQLFGAAIQERLASHRDGRNTSR